MDKLETGTEYNIRKLKQIKEMIESAIDHPEIISSFKITDGVVLNEKMGTGTPMIEMVVSIKESLYNDLKTRQ